MNDRTEYNRLQKAKRRAELKNLEMSAHVRKKQDADTNVDNADKIESHNQATNDLNPSPNTLAFTKTHAIPLSRFKGKGRGVPVDGYVMISKSGNPDATDDELHFVVTVEDWNARLGRKCLHGFYGWSCKLCLN